MPRLVFLVVVVLFTGCGLMGIYVQPTISLSEIAPDSSYGFTPENPIKVGGWGAVGPKNEYIYLSLLTGPNGQPITYRRLGHCCPFKTYNNSYGNWSGQFLGLLDIFEITYSGMAEPLKLYINGYDYEAPKAPSGFGFRKEGS